MKIAYEKTENVKLKDLNEFQGNLKELSKANFNKLWAAIKRKFTEPFSVWQDKKGKIHVLAGHQRLRVLKEMKSQGEPMPVAFPCNFIKADSKTEAKRILLELASQYGRVSEDGLYEFAIENEFSGEFLKDNFEFPGLNLDLFFEGFFGDGEPIEPDPNKEWEDMPEFEQEDIQEGYKKIIVKFDNKKDYQDFTILINQKLTEATKSIWYPKRPERLCDQLGTKEGLVFTEENNEK